MAMTEAQITARLTLIDTRLDSLLAQDASQLSIRGRTIVMRDIEQLERLRDKYSRMLAVVSGTSRPTVIRFHEPST